jgi:hypothetical protein
MARYPYAIGAGHDAASLTVIEDFMRFPPIGTPVPLPPVRTKVKRGTVRYDGARVVYWRWTGIPRADFNLFIDTYLGGFDAHSAAVTICTRERNDGFGTYNAYLQQPQIDVDYKRTTGGMVVELSIEFHIRAAIGAYDSGFDAGYEV